MKILRIDSYINFALVALWVIFIVGSGRIGHSVFPYLTLVVYIIVPAVLYGISFSQLTKHSQLD